MAIPRGKTSHGEDPLLGAPILISGVGNSYFRCWHRKMGSFEPADEAG